MDVLIVKGCLLLSGTVTTVCKTFESNGKQYCTTYVVLYCSQHVQGIARLHYTVQHASTPHSLPFGHFLPCGQFPPDYLIGQLSLWKVCTPENSLRDISQSWNFIGWELSRRKIGIKVRIGLVETVGGKLPEELLARWELSGD